MEGKLITTDLLFNYIYINFTADEISYALFLCLAVDAFCILRCIKRESMYMCVCVSISASEMK